MRNRDMTDPLQDAISDFQARAVSKAEDYGLTIEEVTDPGVRASKGDLLFEFTQDGGELVVAFASALRPDRYYAAEYVAVLLGALSREKLARYSQLLDEFVARDNPDADPPAPLCATDQLLEWATTNANQLEEGFCHNPHAAAALDHLVDSYLTGPGPSTDTAFEEPNL